MDGAGKHYALTNAHVTNSAGCKAAGLKIRPLVYVGNYAENVPGADVQILGADNPAVGVANADLREGVVNANDIAYVKMTAGIQISCRYLLLGSNGFAPSGCPLFPCRQIVQRPRICQGTWRSSETSRWLL